MEMLICGPQRSPTMAAMNSAIDADQKMRTAVIGLTLQLYSGQRLSAVGYRRSAQAGTVDSPRGFRCTLVEAPTSRPKTEWICASAPADTDARAKPRLGICSFRRTVSPP